MPWEETEDYIRSGHKSTEGYDKNKCEEGTEVISFLFAKADGWTMSKAKEWFAKSESRRGTGKARKRAK